MLTQFANLQLSREELKEIHASLLLRAMVEDRLRHERGQEQIGDRKLLISISALLGKDDRAFEEFEQQLSDEVWEYAWYAFTEEWAWYRALQEAEKMFRRSRSSQTGSAFEKAVELQYRNHFETYIAEIDMLDHEIKKPIRKKQKQVR